VRDENRDDFFKLRVQALREDVDIYCSQRIGNILFPQCRAVFHKKCRNVEAERITSGGVRQSGLETSVAQNLSKTTNLHGHYLSLALGFNWLLFQQHDLAAQLSWCKNLDPR
jgi:hypothetical protein